MKLYKTMPYHVLERENWSVDYLMASLESKTGRGDPLSEWVLFNPTRVDRKKIEKTDSYSYLDLSSISHEHGIITEPKKILGENLPARATLKVQDGDILLSSVRPERNHVALVDEVLDGSIVNNTFFVLRPKQRKYSEVLYFALRSREVNEQLTLLAQGTAIPTIKKRDIESFQIPAIRTSSEHQEIARTLYKDWVGKQMNQQSLQEIVERIFVEKGLLHVEEEFGMPDLLFKSVPYDQLEDTWHADAHLSTDRTPIRWLIETQTMEEVLVKARSGASISSKEYQEEGIPYIRIRDLTGTGVSMKEGVYISEAIANDNAKGIVNKGEVLISRAGSVGKAGLVPDKLDEAVVSQHISMLRVKQNQMDPLFLIYYLNTSWASNDLMRFAAGSAQKFVRLKDIKKLLVPVPDLTLQEDIVQEIENRLKEQIDETIRDRIKAFTEDLWRI